MSTEVGSGYVSVLPKLSPGFANTVNTAFVKSGNQASSSFSNSFASGLDKVGGVISKITAVSAAAAGAAAVAFGGLAKQAVMAYSDYEQLKGGVETLFKDSSDIVLQYADNAFMTAGLSANNYMQTVTSFSASLLQGLGGDTAEAARIADMALTDMADNANKMGTDMQMLQNAYQGFAKQNYMMLDNLKLGYGGTKTEMVRLINDSGILNKKIKDLDGISFDTMIKAIHKVQENLGITGTTSLEAEHTIEGSLKAMKGAWANVLEGMADDSKDFDVLLGNLVKTIDTFGVNAMPRIEMALDSVAKLIDKLAPKVAERLPGLIEKIVPSLVNAAIKIVSALVQSLPTILKAVWDGVTSNAETGFTVLGAVLLSHIGRIFKLITNAISGNGIFGVISGLVGKLSKTISKAFGSHMFDDFIKSTETLRGATSPINDAASSMEKGGKKIAQSSKGISSAGNTVSKAGTKFSEGFQKMVGSAAVIASIGIAIAGAGAGFWLMADGCAKIAEAGPLAAGALAIMGGVLLGFTAIVLTLGKSLSVANAPGILALGGALLLAGAGMAALGAAAALVGSQGMAGIAALAIMSGTLIILVPLLAIFGPALDVASIGLLSFGAAILMAGVGIGIASSGVALLVMSFTQLAGVMPMIAEYGLMTAVSLTAIAGAMILCGGSAIVCGAGFLTLGAMVIVPVASLGILMAEMLLLDAELIVSTGLLAGLMGGFFLAAAGAGALAGIIGNIKSDCESAVGSMWELQSSVDTVGNSVQWLQDAIGGFVDGAIGLFSNLANSGGSSIEQLWATITNATNTGINNVLTACQNMVNGANNIFNNIGDSGYWAGVRLGEKYADGIRSQEWNVRDAVGLLTGAAIQGFQASSHISINSSRTQLGNDYQAPLPANGLLASNDNEATFMSYGSVRGQNDFVRSIGDSTNNEVIKQEITNIYIDGARFNDDKQINDIVMQVVRKIERKAAM